MNPGLCRLAAAVLDRHLEHLRTHLDDYDDVLADELHIRVSVWLGRCRDRFGVSALRSASCWLPAGVPQVGQPPFTI